MLPEIPPPNSNRIPDGTALDVVPICIGSGSGCGIKPAGAGELTTPIGVLPKSIRFGLRYCIERGAFSELPTVVDSALIAAGGGAAALQPPTNGR
jgi:hypothetical protein